MAPQDAPNATIATFGYPETLIAEYSDWVVLLRPQQVTLASLVLACKEPATAFGDISQAAFANLKTVTGDIEAEDLRSDVDANTVTGDITVSTSGIVRANTVSGDITLWLPANVDVDVDFESLSGDIDSDFDITHTGRQSRRATTKSVVHRTFSSCASSFFRRSQQLSRSSQIRAMCWMPSPL